MSVALETLAEGALSTPSRLGEARVAFALALVAGLVWGVLLPLQIAAALA